MRRRSIFVLLALAVLSPRPLHAQPAAAPQAAQDDADRLFREANKLYNDKKYADAEVLYEQAFAKKRTHDIAANLGYAEMNQRKLVEAATHLSFAVRSWPPTGKDDKKQYAVDRLTQIKAEVVTLAIEVSVADAHVMVGEREVGLSPLATEAFAEPGRVVVRAKRPGYRDAEQSIEAAKGSAQSVKLAMEVEAPVVTAAATATAAPSVTVTALPTAAPPERSKLPAYVLGGIGVAGLIAGGVLVGVAESKSAEVRSKTPRDSKGSPLCGQAAPPGAASGSICDELRSAAGTAHMLGSTSVALFAIGGAITGVAIVYWALPSKPSAPAKSASFVIPVLAADGGGLQWTGSF